MEEGCLWHSYWLCYSKRSCQHADAVPACLYDGRIYLKNHVKNVFVPMLLFRPIQLLVKLASAFSADSHTT